MNLDLEPGDFVINPFNKSWGIGQIQSIIKNKATVNFENEGKLVINICLLYTSPSPRDRQKSRMPSSA